jgi:RNase P subunit RPR2
MTCPSCHRFVRVKEIRMHGGAVEEVEATCEKCGPVLITDWEWEDLFGPNE